MQFSLASCRASTCDIFHADLYKVDGKIFFRGKPRALEMPQGCRIEFGIVDVSENVNSKNKKCRRAGGKKVGSGGTYFSVIKEFYKFIIKLWMEIMGY